jgi:hypothetical protein
MDYCEYSQNGEENNPQYEMKLPNIEVPENPRVIIA